MEEMNRGGKNKGKGSKVIKVAVIVLLFFVCNFTMFYLGNALATKGIIVNSTIPEKAMADLENIDDVDKYSELFGLRSLIFSKYDGEIDDEKLLEGAMKGMAASLEDPYTVYMNPEEFNTFLESSQGSFYGIGAQLGVRNEKVTIIAPVEGSPAEAAGLKSGDIVLKVDDYEVKDVNTDAVVSRIRGEEGEPVRLTLQREEGGDPFEVTIVRAEIKTESVKGEMLDDSIAYIQITTFSDEDVSQKFTDTLNELKEQGMKKIILDLRGNPGGYLNECIEIASHFIKEGEVVTYTVDKYGEKIVSNSKGGELLGTPLVVLVDGGSASASEVVTGALRDHQAATIIGTNTFGKGVVQQLLELPNGKGGFKVTTSKYYTPNGENIHHKGIAPDITVEIPKDLFQNGYDRSIDPQFDKALEVIKTK